MSELKHTPGPWKAYALGSEGYVIKTDEPYKTLKERVYPWKLAADNGAVYIDDDTVSMIRVILRKEGVNANDRPTQTQRD